MELRQNRVKHKLRRGEQAYIAGGFTHADDIDAFGPANFDGIWIEGSTALWLLTSWAISRVPVIFGA